MEIDVTADLAQRLIVIVSDPVHDTPDTDLVSGEYPHPASSDPRQNQDNCNRE